MGDGGAHWIRAALQVNPFAYHGKNAPSKVFKDEASYNSALLDECVAQGISLIAVTDHWCVDSAAGLIEAATARGIVALPGFEANSSEGIHVLALFEAGTDLSRVNASIGRCGGTPGGASGDGGAAFVDILKRVTEDGGLPIPAHVNAPPSGLLTTRSGKPLAAMISAADLHAVGVSPRVEAAKDQEAVTAGTGLFQRTHPLGVIHADDVMGPRQLRQAGASCWFKVSSPSLNSLKLAVRTWETRVSLVDPAVQPRPTLKQISWVGGYLDGVRLPLSEDLTALIGGRGAGKSTVIESIRHVLDLPPISKQMRAEHKAMVDQVLQVGTIVRLEVETVVPTVQRFTIEREIPNPPVVLDADGRRTRYAPLDVLGSVEMYGQHELAELAGDPVSVAELVRRFNGTGRDDTETGRLRTLLRQNREDIARAEQARAALETELTQAGRLEEQVSHYEETDVPSKLAGQQRLTSDAAVFDEGTRRIGGVEQRLQSLTRSVEVRDLAATFTDADSSPQKKHLDRVTAAVKRAKDDIDQLLADARTRLMDAAAEIASARTSWEDATRAESESYGEVLRELSDRGLEPGRYVEAKAELVRLRAAAPRLDAQTTAIADLQLAREELLGQLRDHETRRTEELQTAVRFANDETAKVVIVRPARTTDRSHVLEVIRAHTTGQRTQITAAIAAPDFSPRTFADAIRAGADALQPLGIRGAQAAALTSAGEPLARELEELSIDLAVEVLLQVEGAGGPRAMNQLSKGQRATALLLLLLGASDAPLVIDQPEDDLDNNFIYQGVVSNLRGLKGKRQIIVSTHNANVPVLGDAELICVLQSDGIHGRIAADGLGSLDEDAIRSHAENILEGGPAAFNRRHHLYGF